MPRDRQQTTSKIIQAAVRLLKKEGFAGWGINAIAREAGIDKVLIYRYFTSLDGLLGEIAEGTPFWPNPEDLTNSTAQVFIQETISFQKKNNVAPLLLALPNSHPCHEGIREKFSKDLETWLEGIRNQSSGHIDESQLMRLPALIHFQATSGLNRLSVGELWAQVSPPLEWDSGTEFVMFEELPTELL